MTQDFRETRLEDIDQDGQEWICIPWDGVSDAPTLLRRVADAWETVNADPRMRGRV